MNEKQKYQIYKFIISEIAKQTDQNESEFDRLKKMKLLYFFCALSSQRPEFYGIFDNFYALPLGPVESDVYTVEKKKEKPIIEDFISVELKEKIILAIRSIVSSLPLIFKADSWRLVELSHESKVWQEAFKLAKSQGKLSEKMNQEGLLTEKLFS